LILDEYVWDYEEVPADDSLAPERILDEDWYDPEVLYTWAGKCVFIECADTEVRDPYSGECYTMEAACDVTDLCDVDNEWAEFWDMDEWDSGCVSNMASFYDEETLLDNDVEDVAV
jgi:hypothetical protein